MKLEAGKAIWLLILILFSGAANAQTQTGVLDDIVSSYKTASDTWAPIIIGYAFTLFWLLVSIDFVLTGIKLLFKRADFGDVVSEYVHLILIIGFFLALLQFATTSSSNWAMAIIESFRQLGGLAGGLPTIDPSGVFDYGLVSAGALMSQMSLTSPAQSLVIGIVGIGVVVIFALIAAELLFVLISMWVILNAGVIMLGLGGSQWTRNYAINYLRTVLAVGVKLFVIQLLIGAGLALTLDFAENIPAEPTWVDIFSVAGAAIMLYVLVRNIGQLVESLISGSGAASASGSGAVVGAITGAAAGLGAAAAMGAGGVKSAAGAASGAKAAWQLAGEGMSQAGGMTATQTALSSIGGAIAGGTGAAAGAKLGGMFSQVAGAAIEGGKSFGQDFKNQLKGDISAERGTLGGRMGEIMKDKKASMQRQSELNELGADLSGSQMNTQEPITNDKGSSSTPKPSGESASPESNSSAGSTNMGPMVETPNSGGSATSAAASNTVLEPPSVQTTSTAPATSSGSSHASGDLPPNGYISGVPGQESLGAYANMDDPKPSEPESPRSPKGITVSGQEESKGSESPRSPKGITVSGQEEPKSSKSPKGITVTDSNS
ncbi:P-type conjugative transfer protein TrbL [Microbulbifer aggregans]|uniref:P-type conjugative transfer protein TrbL n=1 Tax=Microbulbifer aggregans TaxID=1769779 RepID=UPI001CFD8794|nr:P-type conjugative transfer protein TrbL [Microbulbifer aggregans]